MRCYNCGVELKPENTDLPFKISKKSILIIKNLPVLECPNCKEYLIEDAIMENLEKVINGVDEKTELEIVAYT